MAWLLRGNLPWSNAEPQEIERQIRDPLMPNIVTTESVIQEYLTRARKLQIDEVPNYDELYNILSQEAGILDFPQ
jgi:hypothetical protein